jgi:hypothetical protein
MRLESRRHACKVTQGTYSCSGGKDVLMCLESRHTTYNRDVLMRLESRHNTRDAYYKTYYRRCILQERLEEMHVASLKA